MAVGERQKMNEGGMNVERLCVQLRLRKLRKKKPAARIRGRAGLVELTMLLCLRLARTEQVHSVDAENSARLLDVGGARSSSHRPSSHYRK